jgi:hypothetical protein
MSEATKDLEERIKAAEEYWRDNSCSMREAARGKASLGGTIILGALS